MKLHILNCLFISLLCTCLLGCSNNDGTALRSKTPAELQKQVQHYLQLQDSSHLSQDEKLQNLRNFYATFSKQERAYIYEPIFTRLFFGGYANPDSAILNFFRRQSKDKENPKRVRIDAYFKRAGYFLYIQEQPDSGLKSLERAMQFQYLFNDTLYKSYYTLYAQAHMQKGHFSEAARYYLHAIKIVEKMGDSAAIIGNIGNLANVYAQMDEDQKALPLQKLALAYFERHKDTGAMFIGAVGVAGSYIKLNKKDTAFRYFQKAQKLLASGVQNASVTFILYNNLGEIYTDQGNYQKARQYFDLNKKLLPKLHSQAQNQIYTVFSTPAYAQIKDVSADVQAIKGYVDDYLANNNFNEARRGLQSLYKIYQITGKDQAALRYHIMFDSINNLLTNRWNKKDIEQLKTKYELQKKELRIEIQEKQLAQKNSFNHLMILVMIILISGVAFINTRNSLKRKKREIALQQQFTQQLLQRTEEERGRIARDLHDSLGQNLLLLKNDLPHIEPSRIDALIGEVRSISRNIHPTMLNQIGFKNSVEAICLQIMEKEQIFITTDIQYTDFLSKQGELQLFRIIQEALNNIIKHAAAQAARIEIKEFNNLVIVHIEDNGKGFDVEQTLNNPAAFGLISIIERSKVFQGKATIESSPEGTVIVVEVPKKQLPRKRPYRFNT